MPAIGTWPTFDLWRMLSCDASLRAEAIPESKLRWAQP